MNLALSLRQRLALEAVLGAQRGTVEQLLTFGDILRKIRVSDEDRERCVRPLPDGRAIVDLEATKRAPEIEVDLEKEEVRKLLKVLTSWEGFGPADLEWLLPLQAALEKEK
jgi:hypothetical protein